MRIIKQLTPDGDAVFLPHGDDVDAEGTAGALPVLFVHGQLSSSVCMLPVAQRFAARTGRRWAALDLPWHGESRRPTTPSLETMPRAVLAALDHLGWSKAVVVGHSLGGWSCLDAMLMDPDCAIAHAVLVGCPNDLRENTREEFRGFADMIQSDGITDVAVDVVLMRSYGHRSGHVPDDMRPVVNAQLKANDPTAAAHVFRLVADRAPTEARLGSLTGRVSIVVGDQDVIVRPKEAALMAERLGVCVHTVAGGSHFPFVDAPEAFDEQLDRALAGGIIVS